MSDTDQSKTDPIEDILNFLEPILIENQLMDPSLTLESIDLTEEFLGAIFSICPEDLLPKLKVSLEHYQNNQEIIMTGITTSLYSFVKKYQIEKQFDADLAIKFATIAKTLLYSVTIYPITRVFSTSAYNFALKSLTDFLEMSRNIKELSLPECQKLHKVIAKLKVNQTLHN